jgi:hypothetical protein
LLMSMNSINVSLPGQTFTNTVNFTSTTTFTVPYNVTQLYVKLWAGGGGGNGDTRTGGGSGFIGGYLSVAPNDVLNIDIGAGGLARNLTENCDIPRGKIHAGAGGGGSRIYKNVDSYFIAGGGGGAGESGNGGVGGGTSSLGGNAYCTGCHDEDPTAGANANFSGSIMAGGEPGRDNSCPDEEDPPNYQTSTVESGGGGSGYAGGGGGGQGAGGGGATSGFEGGYLVSNISGSGINPGNNTDPDYTSNYGQGGGYGSGVQGYIVIKY